MSNLLGQISVNANSDFKWHELAFTLQFTSEINVYLCLSFQVEGTYPTVFHSFQSSQLAFSLLMDFSQINFLLVYTEVLTSDPPINFVLLWRGN